MAPLNSPAAPLENFENGVIVAGAGIGGLAAAKALHMVSHVLAAMLRLLPWFKFLATGSLGVSVTRVSL